MDITKDLGDWWEERKGVFIYQKSKQSTNVLFA